MSTQITIHGKRVETIYAFTVEYKGESITGRYIQIEGEDADEPLGLLDEGKKLEFDNPYTMPSMSEDKWDIFAKDVEQAIKAYNKAHG